MKAVPLSPAKTPLRRHALPPDRPLPSPEDDARNGLLRPPRTVPPKYFYDDVGSRLFDRICETPEYYPTRTEAALLARYAGAIVAAARPACILELGAGACRKTGWLLDACQAAGLTPGYWPLDVCEEALLTAGAQLQAAYPWLQVDAVVGDYTGGLSSLPAMAGPRLAVFLGGTLGNFEADEAVRFLQDVRAVMAPGDRLLLGVDRVKSPVVLHAAYNDAQGLTARFNRNALRVLNRRLDADFDPEAFEHRAFYDPDRAQVEMHLVAQRDMTVRLGALGETLAIAAGEGIRTEISRKFTLEALQALLADAGFICERHFEAEGGAFSLVLARPEGDG